MASQLGASALICIPTYNESDNVEPLAAEIFKVVPKNWHILFIDDGSPDGTGALCDSLAAKDPRVHVLHRKGKLGLATAYIQGFQWGLKASQNFDWFFEMDADFSHQPLHLNDFANAIESKKWDVICGSRYVPGGGVSNWDEGRLLLSRLGTVYSQFWLRYSVQDWTGGFNAWSRATVESLKLESIRSKGYAFQIEMKYRALVQGLKLLETPIVFQERRAGASKMSGSIVKEALLGVARLKWDFERGRLF
jgi:dolichol-phosphate mannosyltransferase